MNNFKKTKKTVAVVLSLLMVLFATNLITVSAHSNNLNENTESSDVAQVSGETTDNIVLSIEESPVYFREGLDNTSQYRTIHTPWITYTGDVTITGTSQSNTVTVMSGTHNITLDELCIDVSDTGSDNPAFDIQNESKVVLTLAQGTENVLISDDKCAGLQVNSGEENTKFDVENIVIDEKRASVEITGSGSLKAVGGVGGGAGIGGKYYYSAGEILITGDVNVTAVAPASLYEWGGAGIGGGTCGYGGIITINGNATVTAVGSRLGAGIGGGTMASGGIITIDGNANVTASATVGSGIGGGFCECGYENITIGGNAVVSAKTESESPGIGVSGSALDGLIEGATNSIVIKDNPTITAIGGSEAAGIGSGSGADSGNINISGGTIVAQGYKGIGAGYHGNDGQIDIDYDNADVTTTNLYK